MQQPLFNPVSSTDYLPAPKLRELQTERFARIIRRAYENVPFFRKRMDDRNRTPDSFRSLEDVALLPFTVKADLRETYPFGLFASPLKEIVRLHASSGTTGKPIVVAYTKGDLAVWEEAMMRTLAAAGVSSGDIVQNSFGYGLFTGGLGAHYGAEGLGATVIPASGGNTERQIMLMKDFGVTVICCTPSYFVHLIEEAGKMGVDLRKLPLRIGIFGAEPWTFEMRRHIEEAAGIKAFDIYGLSEITGPGVGAECECQCGLHIFEDHFYPEIIDPDTLEVLPDGKEGELVLSTLSKMAMPMLRYRTRDLTSILTEKCACGRTIRRISKISHRSDDMFIIRGVNVFPSQIETAILNEEKHLPHYQIILTRSHGLDNIEVDIEVTPEMFSDKVSAMEELTQRFSHAIERVISLRVLVKMLPPNSVPRSEGKARRVIDKRNL
ncbi:MAG: Phenylacetate-coenzyme A ligase [Lentisphaerae bacterium ADurb.Bin242]|nr:MAG: Phenylacetate-coenzyme A ligase [Lentisphaerae bacterium ADurb.Bin242]